MGLTLMDLAPAPPALRHRPTHDWMIARKILAPEGEADAGIEVLRGVARPRAKPPHHYAVILAQGPGRRHAQTGFAPPPPCQVGDIVMIRAVAGDAETIEGEEYFWLMPDEVLAVIAPEPPALVTS